MNAGTSEIVIIEHFDAPREVVFRSWTETRHVREWFAPDGYTVIDCKFDAKAGEQWHVTFASQDGERHTEFGEFLEVEPPARLAFTLTQRDSRGTTGPRTIVTVTFTQIGARTRMEFRQSGYRGAAHRDANAEGWRECLRKLGSHLAVTDYSRGGL